MLLEWQNPYLFPYEIEHRLVYSNPVAVQTPNVYACSWHKSINSKKILSFVCHPRKMTSLFLVRSVFELSPHYSMFLSHVSSKTRLMLGRCRLYGCCRKNVVIFPSSFLPSYNWIWDSVVSLFYHIVMGLESVDCYIHWFDVAHFKVVCVSVAW